MLCLRDQLGKIPASHCHYWVTSGDEIDDVDDADWSISAGRLRKTEPRPFFSLSLSLPFSSILFHSPPLSLLSFLFLRRLLKMASRPRSPLKLFQLAPVSQPGGWPRKREAEMKRVERERGRIREGRRRRRRERMAQHSIEPERWEEERNGKEKKKP